MKQQGWWLYVAVIALIGIAVYQYFYPANLLQRTVLFCFRCPAPWWMPQAGGQ